MMVQIIPSAVDKSVQLGWAGEGHCAQCGGTRSFRAVLYYRVRSYYWVVRWISQRIYVTICSSCGGEMVGEGRSVAAAAAADTRNGRAARVPWFDRFGWIVAAAVVAVLIAVAVVAGQQDRAADDARIAAPRVGDLYEVNLARMVRPAQAPVMYAIVQVIEVRGDTVTIRAAMRYYTESRGTGQDIRSGVARTDAYYGPERLIFTRAELQQFRRDGVISDVE